MKVPSGAGTTQIHNEIGESLAIFQNTNPIVFFILSLYSLIYCIKEGIKDNLFGD